jgi:hypothetical protein
MWEPRRASPGGCVRDVSRLEIKGRCNGETHATTAEAIAVTTKKKKALADNRERVVINIAAAKGEMKVLGGSISDAFNLILLNQVYKTMWTAHSDAEARNVQTIAAAMAMAGISPKDELEGMMAAQLVASHNAAMECYRRAMLSEQTFEGRRENLNQASKMSRTHAALVEALNRHRGKGQQKMTVEHVHVHAGGQAVVGVVEPPGGGNSKFEEQPHAKQIANASEPALPCPDSESDALPVSRNGKRALPNARREGTRRRQGQ